MTKKMTRNNVVSLYSVIRDLKRSNLKGDALTKYILLRVKMKRVVDEYEVARTEILEQTKVDDSAEWEKSFGKVMTEWLNEKVDFDLAIFTVEECISLISLNDLQGTVDDFIIELMVNETK